MYLVAGGYVHSSLLLLFAIEILVAPYVVQDDRVGPAYLISEQGDLIDHAEFVHSQSSQVAGLLFTDGRGFRNRAYRLV